MTTITATPTEYVEALPRLMGYVPHDSLVIAAMPTSQARPVESSASIMRFDLPTSAEDVEALLAALTATYLCPGHPAFAGWQDVMLLVWDEHNHSNEHTAHALRRVMRATRQDTPYTVRAVLTSTADSVLGYCHSKDGETTPIRVPRSASTSALEAQLVVRGHQALPNREAVAATVAAGQGATGLRVIEVHLGDFTQVWERAANAENCLTAEQAAMLAAGLANLSLRDQALCTITTALGAEGEALGGQKLTDEQLGHLLDNLTRAARSYTDSPGMSDLLAVICFTAWALGQGTLASVALERAERINPRHRLTVLMAVAISQGIRFPR